MNANWASAGAGTEVKWNPLWEIREVALDQTLEDLPPHLTDEVTEVQTGKAGG